MSEAPRHWFKNSKGLWESREPNDADKKRHLLNQQWAHKHITLQQALEKMQEQDCLPENFQ